MKLTSSYEWSEMKWLLSESSVECWQLSQAQQGRLWRDGTIVSGQLTIDKSLGVGYSPESNNMSTEAGESPLLEAIAWEDTVSWVGAVVICELWRLVVVL
jgi:hypothetical protein